ncbi:hypothetical protein V1477_011822 [Vespula maculifrons]|uniref:Uncharacterized protein n=1 Tax=Vespula maculifrons TaxID=7453 RepID=A0ABD2C096_VESMC
MLSLLLLDHSIHFLPLFFGRLFGGGDEEQRMVMGIKDTETILFYDYLPSTLRSRSYREASSLLEARAIHQQQRCPIGGCTWPWHPDRKLGTSFEGTSAWTPDQHRKYDITSSYHMNYFIGNLFFAIILSDDDEDDDDEDDEDEEEEEEEEDEDDDDDDDDERRMLESAEQEEVEEEEEEEEEERRVERVPAE